jgi:subtilase family serine protease
MRLLHHPVRAGAVAVLGLATIAMTGSFGLAAASAAPVTAPAFTVLKNSLPKTTDHKTGIYSSSRMGIEISLKPRNATGLARELHTAYTRHSGGYHHWLRRGQFDARYAPSRATRAAVASYLRGAGLTVRAGSSPFLLRATGSSARIDAALHTTLSTYRDPRGVRYFANSAPVSLPAALAGHVSGVIGLSSTVRERSMAVPTRAVSHGRAWNGQAWNGKAWNGTAKDASPGGRAWNGTAKDASPGSRAWNGTASPGGRAWNGTAANASCEEPYPTAAEFYAAVNEGTPIPFGYGAGPGCNGLTPSQVNGIYGAPHVGPSGQGAGVNIGVFELSAYQQSDIDTYARTFYGASYTPPLVNVTVDGGPLAPQCPVGDTCPPDANGYAGDVEVDADIEIQLAVAPDVSSLVVYDAPNDVTGQTELDEYTAIANADQVASVSSSWAVCENDLGSAMAQAENTVFEQMALQGQSMFSAAGDTGAFECIRSDGTTIPNTLDPASQPWVTGVGGTSMESYNPGTSASPSYPPAGTESVWNVDGLCNTSADEGNFPGFFWCAATGAGGGGSSQYWGRPFYQAGPGVNNPNTTYANGTTQCALATAGTPCREVPDISANADEFTPYVEYCTDNANTPFGECGAFSSTNAPGWFGIGGTSLSSPLWSAIIADRDSFQHYRSGNVNPLLYLLFNLAPNAYFHDITGVGQATNNNGLFPTTPGYDEATGIGTPKMAALITETL